jgi:GNAT superfamily N-acetyltransferase
VIETLHAELVQTGAFALVPLDGADERRWLDCDLASLAENRLGDLTDPRHLDEQRRADWLARAADERPWPLSARSKYERCYWILEDGQPAGTIALARPRPGSEWLRVSSFYVFPTYRGSGVGRRALGQVQEALARHDLGLRLETSWCWQRAVRFYLASGMWIYMWKHDLTFCWEPRTPKPQIDIGDGTASLSVSVGQEDIVLARAQRRGEALVLETPPPALAKDDRMGDAYWHATSTLALALALHGWPLVRSQEDWTRSYFADAGAPESLAYKITRWEAWAAKQGWIVQTPRIPGVQYPTWNELEARWHAESKALDAELTAATPAEKDAKASADGTKLG